MTTHWTLLYDGDCPLCRRAAGWVRANTRPGAVDPVPCQDPDRAVRFPQVSDADCMAAMQLVQHDGVVHAGERALPHLLGQATQRRWRVVGRLLRIPGVLWVARPIYALIARNRLALSSFFVRKEPGGPACGIDGKDSGCGE